MTLARLAPKEEEEEEEEEDGLKAVGSTCRHIKQQVFLPPEVSVPSLEVEVEAGDLASSILFHSVFSFI